MKLPSKLILQVMFVFLLTLFGSAYASETAKNEAPHQVVQGVTDAMMKVIKDGNPNTETEKYFTKIRETLEPVVSFSFIAKSVMGGYWDKATPSQQDAFTETFTRSMVETLGKGMANYSDVKITTKAPAGDISTLKRVEVIQEVAGADGTTRISYTMAQNKSGEWKLINVILNGVNLGKSFRDQFSQAMKQNDNNLDKVIATWAQKA